MKVTSQKSHDVGYWQLGSLSLVLVLYRVHRIKEEKGKEDAKEKTTRDALDTGYEKSRRV